MIPLAVPNLAGNERKYLNECIDTTFVSSVGQFVVKLEQMMCEETGARYGIATSSGTTALQVALLSVGVKQDELVLIPSYTFIATANAVKHCGAEPWCVDVALDSWALSPSILQQELENKTFEENGNIFHKSTGKRVAAIVPVYTFGLPADMEAIHSVAKRYHLPVVADAAAAIGASYRGRKLGTLADVTSFSFNGNKTITCGGGGCIISNDKEIAEYARHISTTARVGSEYDFDMVGYNYRMTNLQAAVGCAQLERLKDFIDRKRQIRDYYREKLCGCEGINSFPEPAWAQGSCWFSGIFFENAKTGFVQELCRKLREAEIESKLFWKPVHRQAPYRDMESSQMATTDYIWDKVLVLPSSTNISIDELEYVGNTVIGILGQ